MTAEYICSSQALLPSVEFTKRSLDALLNANNGFLLREFRLTFRDLLADLKDSNLLASFQNWRTTFGSLLFLYLL